MRYLTHDIEESLQVDVFTTASLQSLYSIPTAVTFLDRYNLMEEYLSSTFANVEFMQNSDGSRKGITHCESNALLLATSPLEEDI